MVHAPGKWFVHSADWIVMPVTKSKLYHPVVDRRWYWDHPDSTNEGSGIPLHLRNQIAVVINIAAKSVILIQTSKRKSFARFRSRPKNKCFHQTCRTWEEVGAVNHFHDQGTEPFADVLFDNSPTRCTRPPMEYSKATFKYLIVVELAVEGDVTESWVQCVFWWLSLAFSTVS